MRRNVQRVFCDICTQEVKSRKDLFRERDEATDVISTIDSQNRPIKPQLRSANLDICQYCGDMILKGNYVFRTDIRKSEPGHPYYYDMAYNASPPIYRRKP